MTNRNTMNFIKLKILLCSFLLLLLSSTLKAQELVVSLEAESGTLTAPAKVKSVNGYSGNAYVGDNDAGSAITFADVEVNKAGRYEFKTYYTCVGSRSIAIKANNLSEVVSATVKSTSDWNAPPTETMSVYINLNQGKNTIIITPYPSGQGGPNMDKFEILTAAQPGEFPILLEAENARLFGSLKVKPLDGSTISGLSGGKYIGDFNQSAKSHLQFVDVEIPETGTYQLKVFSMGSSRNLSIKVNQYKKSIIRTKDSQNWNDAPPAEVSTLIYLDKGKNKLTFGTYNDDGPNLDKFEIHQTNESIPQPEVENLSFISDFTDEAEITAQYNNETLSYVTDNSEFTIYNVPGVTSTQITAKCKYPILLTGYLLSSGTDEIEDVTKWTLESSTNGTTWKTVTSNSSTDLSGAYLFTINRSYGDGATQSAQYYRLTAKGSTDINVAEWQLFGVPYLTNTDGKSFPQDITEGVNVTTNATGYPEGAFGTDWSEKFYNLFNRKLNSKYYMSGSKQFYVEIDLGKAYQLTSYTLTSADAFADRDPAKWTFNGYNDEIGWVELDRRVEFAFPCRYATMRFDINDLKGYSKFLLDVETNNGSPDTQLLKWQLFGKEHTGSGIVTPVNKSSHYNIYSEQKKLCIQSDINIPATYAIYNIAGLKINQGKLSSSQKDISLSQGIYIVQINSSIENNTTKVIVK